MDLIIIENKIYEIRGQQVMLDFDLAEMYGVETRTLNQSVKRNESRFPVDFMFQLTSKEWREIKLHNTVNQTYTDNSSQIVMSSAPKNRGERYLPYAFTEHGVAMLSSVLKSGRAIEMNIKIIRAFVAVRKYILQAKPSNSIEERIKALEQANEELLKDMNDLSEDTRNSFDELFNAFAKLTNKINVSKTSVPRNPIGFKQQQN